MLDPPRPEVADAVRACRRAGIRIVMVTGDHALTAEAIARRVGIVRRTAARVVTGRPAATWTTTRCARPASGPTSVLFCRVSPEHKMRVVAALQGLGEVVAVTGDGANDAPALKRADIGVAMGAGGTDVAREAAVMVLLDDSFASIVTAVRLGRSVYRNIRKFLIYLFSHNIAELVPILVADVRRVPARAAHRRAGPRHRPRLRRAAGARAGRRAARARRHGRAAPLPRANRCSPPRWCAGSCSSAPSRPSAWCGVFFWHIHSAGLPFADFTADNPVYREAITMTQAGIVVSQFFNALAVRTDRQSIFRVGLLSNPRLIAAGVPRHRPHGRHQLRPAAAGGVPHRAAAARSTGRCWPASGCCCWPPRKLRKWLLRRRTRAGGRKGGPR